MKDGAPIGAFSGRIATLALLILLTLLAGCAEAPPLPLPEPPPSNVEVPFDQAALNATDALIAQALLLPAFAGHLPQRGVVLDPMLDAASGQQTAATELLQQRVATRMAEKFAAAELLPFRADNLPRAAYLLTGTLTRAFADRPRGSLLVNLALTELKTGTVVAQAWALTRDDGLDNAPLPFYADSPVLVKDRVVDGYVTTSATGAGKPANAYYLERLAVAPVISDATALYNAERYAESLAKYRAAGNQAGGDQLRVLDGIYLASVKTGRSAEAETSFGRLVAHGIANNQLGVKFLFNPGSTAFWSDPKVSGVYAMWLRQIARESATAKACMSIVGHTSRTGSESINDVLSLQRAVAVRQRLGAESAVLTARTKALGKGSRENIVGTGTDNAVDALDRRVEFKIMPCG